MKNKAQEECFSAPNHPRGQHQDQADREQRIRYLKKAWQDGSLKINSQRLAQRIIDFESQVEPVLPEVSPPPRSNH